jgi:hypothetical protein
MWITPSEPLPLRPGVTLPLVLEQEVSDGLRRHPGPHRVGTAESYEGGRLLLKVLDTEAGQVAEAMIEEQLLDLKVQDGSVWLGVWG